MSFQSFFFCLSFETCRQNQQSWQKEEKKRKKWQHFILSAREEQQHRNAPLCARLRSKTCQQMLTGVWYTQRGESFLVSWLMAVMTLSFKRPRTHTASTAKGWPAGLPQRSSILAAQAHACRSPRAHAVSTGPPSAITSGSATHCSHSDDQRMHVSVRKGTHQCTCTLMQ